MTKNTYLFYFVRVLVGRAYYVSDVLYVNVFTPAIYLFFSFSFSFT